MTDYYFTIKTNATGYFSSKGSKFHAYIFPINSAEDAKEYLDHLKKKYYDARHHVYAYTLGKNMSEFRANDDGEPPNSAGAPILNKIKSNNLTNVMIVVVRYFGGTKLGVPGLINAYKLAAKDAVNNAKIIKVIIDKKITAICEYEKLKFIKKIIKENDLKPIHQEFTEKCKIVVSVRLNDYEKVKGLFESNRNNMIDVSFED